MVIVMQHGASAKQISAIVARVEVKYGTGALGPDDGAGGVDVAVMDNFIFGEPQAIK